jgi:TrmH family RNA methyltransferase
MERMSEMRARRAVPRNPEQIESRENRWLKRFRAGLCGEPVRLSEDKSGRGAGGEAERLWGREVARREEEDVAGIEGARLVETALGAGVEVLAVLFSESGAKYVARLEPLIPAEARLLRTSDRLFAHASDTETPQGVAALIRPRTATFDDIVAGMPLVLILAGVQDPGNVGTLIRTADAFGASGVIACAAGGIGTANPYSPKALRASAGSAFRLPILRGSSAPIVLAQLRVAGVRVCAACPEDAAAGAHEGGGNSGQRVAAKTAVAPWEIDWRGPVALLVGNEGAGLPAELVRSADAIVRIPHVPHLFAAEAGVVATAAGSRSGVAVATSAAQAEIARAESLNAAVAGSILLYEAARQRGLAPS